MKKIKNIHPGEVLLKEFLVPLKIRQVQLCKATGIPQSRIFEIVEGNRGITANTAIRLGHYFSNSPKFWLGLQNDFDIEEEKQNNKEEYKLMKKLDIHAA